MIKHLPALPFLVFLLAAGNNMYAQTKQYDSLSTQKSSYWQAEIIYTSNNVYLGRKDSLHLPYLTPVIGYYNRSGLYISSGLSYLTATGSSRVDLFYIDAGYTFTRNNVQAQLSATKYFYNHQSTNVNADVKAGVDLYAAYDFGFIQPSMEAAANFSNLTDYILTLGLEHTFYAGNDFSFTPGFSMNAGTQNAYNFYYNKRKFAVRRKKARAGNTNYDINAQVAGAAAFKTLDYECSLPVSYTLNAFTFNFTPCFALPVHPATINYTVKSSAGNQYTAGYHEELKNTFYWSAGITCTF